MAILLAVSGNEFVEERHHLSKVIIWSILCDMANGAR